MEERERERERVRFESIMRDKKREWILDIRRAYSLAGVLNSDKVGRGSHRGNIIVIPHLLY